VIFQDGGWLPYGFSDFVILTASELRGSQIHHNFKFYWNWSNSCKHIPIFQFFQDGGHPPSWICLPRFWTTHKAYLVVFTGVQKLVGIHAIVSMMWKFEFFLCLAWKCMWIWKFEYFACFAWKCLFTPPKLWFWWIWPPKWGGVSIEPHKAHPCMERRRVTYRSSKSVHRCNTFAHSKNTPLKSVGA